MKPFLLTIFLLAASMFHPLQARTENPPTFPCSVVLEPVTRNIPNTKGVALVYKVRLIQSFPRTSVSIHAQHLPEPSTIGDFDGYEGFAFIPGEISWRFKLFPTPGLNSPTWAGRIDDITAKMENVTIEVRPSNSKTEKLGAPILTNHIKNCSVK